MHNSNSTTYLFSSFIKNPDFFFQGYCFVDNDYIYGLEGAIEYEETTGKRISIGEDGCYVLARKIKNDYIFGSDNSGYKKILYFKDDLTGIWVVSNSLNMIISHLKENGVEVTINVANIMVMSQTPTPSQQPVTFETIAKGIKILPLNTYLSISENILSINSFSRSFDSKASYNDLLSDFVEVWSSRLATLLANDSLVIEQALTGGIDSRSVFSLTQLAKKSLEKKTNANHYLVCGLTRGERVDIEIAEKISKYYDYTLNPTRNNYEGRHKLNGYKSYQSWKNICLGSYTPIYFPSLEVSPLHISIGGGGGENHRPFYASYLQSNSFEALINSITKNLKNPTLEKQISINMHEFATQIIEIDKISENELLVAHCKNFRNRFHAGLFPQYKVTFTPLSSYLLDRLVKAGNRDKIQSSQILYDLMSATEGLLDFPFDKPSKTPTEKDRANLVKYRDMNNIYAGNCYLNSNYCIKEERKGLLSSKTALEYLKEDFDKALSTDIVKQVWKESFINDANQIINESIEKGQLPYASSGKPISLIIATALFA